MDKPTPTHALLDVRALEAIKAHLNNIALSQSMILQLCNGLNQFCVVTEGVPNGHEGDPSTISNNS